MEAIYIQDVKLEPLDTYINTKPSNRAADREKIGDIYRTSPDHLAIVCAHCSAEFPLFNQFAVHIQQHLHQIELNVLKSNIVSEHSQTNDSNVDDLDLETIHDNCDSDFDWPEDVVDPTVDPKIASAGIPTAANANYSSPHCDFDFESDRMLLKHESTHAEHQNIHECHECNCKFSTSAAYSSHVRQCHQKVACTICNKTYSKQAYQNHMAGHRNPDKLYCSPCNRQFGTASNFSRHLKNVHKLSMDDVKCEKPSPRTYECFQCHSAFKTFRKCRSHICAGESDGSCTTNKSTFMCPHCARSFCVYKLYYNHVQSHCRIMCTICSRTYSNNAFRVHMTGHTRADQLTCLPCNKQFSTKSNFVRHSRVVHSTEFDERRNTATNWEDGLSCSYECFECHRSLNGLSECQAHVKKHNASIVTAALKSKTESESSSPTAFFETEIPTSTIGITNQPTMAKVPGFCCPQCNKCFRDEGKLQSHLEEHSGIEKAYKCLLCYRSFDVYKQYYGHVQNHKKITCTVCNKTYTKSAYHNHMVSHRKAEKLFCPQCNKGFSTVSNFRRHMKNVHEVDSTGATNLATMKPMYKCEKCHRAFGTEKKYSVHLLSHEQYRECTICNRTYAKAAYYNHMARHTSRKSLFCSLCNRQFGTSSNFKRHMRKVHGEIDGGEGASTWTTRSEDEIGQGITEIADQRSANRITVKCELCNEEFPNKTQLSRHLIERHSTLPNPGKYDQVTCELCDRQIAKAQIKQHMQRHRSDTVFRCDLCDAQFIYQHLLVRHQRKHSNERKYLCEFCPMAFKQTSHLDLHRRRHTGEFIYKCKWCSKGFLEKRAMKNHSVAVHQTEWNG